MITSLNSQHTANTTEQDLNHIIITVVLLRLNRDQIVKTARLTGCKNFVGKRKEFIFNAFVDLKPVERFENGSDM